MYGMCTDQFSLETLLWRISGATDIQLKDVPLIGLP